ncbi:hypothetical protein TRIUR3_33512 [Triticum urartu]|uniref:Uncharacterized protein n=1 Tax=Triticum urartu TaxID=4572 RepID=M7Z3E1_TRIUA|nr:hypothetical protein TRIUR3_33512 [Triticum urartu]
MVNERDGVQSFLSPCYRESGTSGRSMYAWKEFKNAGVVPCNERVHLNNLTGDTLKFKANKRTYIVKCHKGPERAQCVGQQEGEGLRSITGSVDVLLRIKILWLGTL